MRIRDLYALGCALMATTSVASAQKKCTLPASSRSVSGYLYATLVPLDDHALPRDYSALLLQSMQQGYRPTAPIALAAYQVSDSIAASGGYASARFTVTDVGHAQDVQLVASSLSPTFDADLLHVIALTDSSGLIPPFPEGTTGRRAYELRLQTGPVTVDELRRRDTANVVVAPWASASIQIWNNAHAVRSAEAAPDPGAPRTFVVGPDGHIAPGTAEPEARDFVVRAQFEPATIAGCPVRALVQQSR